MGKEVDLEALAVQYIWEHLERLNMGRPSIRRWRSAFTEPPRAAVLFTISFALMKEHIREEIQLPVAVLTEDGILRFLVGSGGIDLKQHKSPRGGDHIG